MDPAWEVAAFRRQKRAAKPVRHKVTASGEPPETCRWWTHELPWMVVVLGTVLLLLALTVYSLIPTRSARYVVLTGDDWRRNPSPVLDRAAQ
ncbi:hypothetical protein MTO96_034769 [Rhipicephalus appendiculatus]